MTITTNPFTPYTTTCPFPDNITPLSPNGYHFAVTKLPEMTFFCQQVNLPGITLGVPEYATPFVTAPLPGDHLTYDTLSIQFLIDADMKNYKALFNWLVALGFPERYEQYSAFIAKDKTNFSELAKNFSDATMSMLTGNNQISQTITFVDLFPISIESLTFQSTNTDVQYLVGNASFRYSYYKFI